MSAPSLSNLRSAIEKQDAGGLHLEQPSGVGMGNGERFLDLLEELCLSLETAEEP